jgi:hypothetical protein
MACVMLLAMLLYKRSVGLLYERKWTRMQARKTDRFAGLRQLLLHSQGCRPRLLLCMQQSDPSQAHSLDCLR